MMKSSHRNTSNKIKCAICYTDISDLCKVYQDAKTKGIVCADCKKKFAGENLELIIYLLFIYGGYFGMRKKEEFSLIKILEEFDFYTSSESFDLEELNRKLMHIAILHGFTPKDYKKYLRSMVKDEF